MAKVYCDSCGKECNTGAQFVYKCKKCGYTTCNSCHTYTCSRCGAVVNEKIRS